MVVQPVLSCGDISLSLVDQLLVRADFMQGYAGTRGKIRRYFRVARVVRRKNILEI